MIHLKLFFFNILEIIILINEFSALKVQGIIGGDVAGEYDYKYQVFLRRGNRVTCGGGLLSSRHVLVAANCIFSNEDKYFEFRRLLVVGATTNAFYTNANAVVSEVEKVYLPSGYQHSDNSLYEKGYSVAEDIAVVKLAVAFPTKRNSGLQILKLPSGNEQLTDKELVIGGFGYNSIAYVKDVYAPDFDLKRLGTSDGKLRYAKVKVLPYEECGYFRSLFKEGEALCARMEQRNPLRPEGVCIGDAGGPLVLDNDIVVGVLIAASMQCQENLLPAIYANVSHHIGFINYALSDVVTSDMVTYTWGGIHNLVRQSNSVNSETSSRLDYLAR